MGNKIKVSECIGFKTIPMNADQNTHHQHRDWYHQSKPSYSLRHLPSSVQLVISFISDGIQDKYQNALNSKRYFLWTQIEVLTTTFNTCTTG